jgi:phosphoribosylglycinamide formyltransferase 1
MSINIALFASGSGSNAENIVNYFKNKPVFEFPLIISNRNDAFVHERAKKIGIPSLTFSKRDFEIANPIIETLNTYQIDCIVLAGFLLKVPEAIINAYPYKIINIHPALLPKFGGKGMYGYHVHEAVVANKETETGITIHYVNSEYDQGSIIFQAKCTVNPNDTPDDVAAKVHKLEYIHFPEKIEQLWG